jgi:hypothetical protein
VLRRQVARAIYSLNLAFRAAENDEFRKLISLLAPGSKPPGRKCLAGSLLDEVYLQQVHTLRKQLAGSFCTLSADGWTGAMGHPIIGFAVGKHCLSLTSTMGLPHVEANVRNWLSQGLSEARDLLGVRVAGLVTDSASNMNAGRDDLIEIAGERLPTFGYGCQAHWVNLVFGDLLKDKGRASVLERTVAVLKAFRQVCPSLHPAHRPMPSRLRPIP